MRPELLPPTDAFAKSTSNDRDFELFTRPFNVAPEEAAALADADAEDCDCPCEPAEPAAGAHAESKAAFSQHQEEAAFR